MGSERRGPLRQLDDQVAPRAVADGQEQRCHAPSARESQRPSRDDAAPLSGVTTGTLKAPYVAGMMPHTASLLRVSFPKAGTYALKTKAGEDYMAGVKTVGEDNVLKLKVIVK